MVVAFEWLEAPTNGHSEQRALQVEGTTSANFQRHERLFINKKSNVARRDQVKGGQCEVRSEE